jgi:hypothetical protein
MELVMLALSGTYVRRAQDETTNPGSLHSLISYSACTTRDCRINCAFSRLNGLRDDPATGKSCIVTERMAMGNRCFPVLACIGLYWPVLGDAGCRSIVDLCYEICQPNFEATRLLICVARARARLDRTINQVAARSGLSNSVTCLRICRDVPTTRIALPRGCTKRLALLIKGKCSMCAH